MLITTLTLEETTNISAVSQSPAVVNGKELSDYLGLTVEDLKNGSGVLLTEYDGTYTNLDGSVMVTLNESTGLIDMLVASDRDVGFTVCRRISRDGPRTGKKHRTGVCFGFRRI